MKQLLVVMFLLVACAAWSQQGTIAVISSFPSVNVEARQVEVYLPAGYGDDTTTRYPVMYMHDGQNVFNPATSYGGQEWGVDEALDTLIAKGVVPPMIVVAVWNSPLRRREFMPEQPFYELPDSLQQLFADNTGGTPISDRYLAFLTAELKPHIDSVYRTLPGPATTAIAGSSFGGLISLYAMSRYPQLFGYAACISTHWIVAFDDKLQGFPLTLISWFDRHLPDPDNHTIYFDFGTETLDQYYEPWQRVMDDRLQKGGYIEGKNWITRKFEGEEHNEVYWRERFPDILRFLYVR